jgi:hypothetical protein
MPTLRNIAVLQALALTGTLLSSIVSSGAAAATSEYEVKAAFLVNFAKFVEWPASVFGSAAAPVLIGVVGDDPFGRGIDDAVRGKFLDGRSITVERVDWREDLTGFQIVFISGSEQRRLKDILRPLESTSVLTVSDMGDFCRNGGVIAFVSVDQRVRFEVNGAAARRQGLKVSSKLLSLATTVY